MTDSIPTGAVSISPTLTIRLENKRPVELLDLTASLNALGEYYGEFVHGHGFDPVAENVRLYITELKSGSIIAELAALADQTSFMLDHKSVFAAFLTNFQDILNFFLTLSRSEAIPPTNAVTRAEAERVSQIIEPVAKDHGSQLFLNVGGDLTININITSDQANVAQNNIRRFLGPAPTQPSNFAKEPLTLHQVRGDTSKIGDRGIIETFGKKPVRLEFMNEEAKRAILDRPGNPFHFVFIVDGQVGTADGKPAVYKIFTVHDAIDKPTG